MPPQLRVRSDESLAAPTCARRGQAHLATTRPAPDTRCKHGRLASLRWERRMHTCARMSVHAHSCAHMRTPAGRRHAPSTTRAPRALRPPCSGPQGPVHPPRPASPTCGAQSGSPTGAAVGKAAPHKDGRGCRRALRGGGTQRGRARRCKAVPQGCAARTARAAAQPRGSAGTRPPPWPGPGGQSRSPQRRAHPGAPRRRPGPGAAAAGPRQTSGCARVHLGKGGSSERARSQLGGPLPVDSAHSCMLRRGLVRSSSRRRRPRTRVPLPQRLGRRLQLRQLVIECVLHLKFEIKMVSPIGLSGGSA